MLLLSHMNIDYLALFSYAKYKKRVLDMKETNIAALQGNVGVRLLCREPIPRRHLPDSVLVPRK